MHALSPAELGKISSTVISKLHQHPELKQEIQLNDYHGFQKGKLPRILLGNYDSDVLQAEVVEVTTDLSSEIHSHKHSHAYCYILGSKEGFPDPVNAYAFLGTQWKPVSAGSIVDIPPGIPHGFTVENGMLYFLSVQSPSIERQGEDDYHREKHVPLRRKS